MFKYLRLIPTVGIRVLRDDLKYFRRYEKHPERYTLQEKWLKGQEAVKYIFKCVRADIRVQGLENVEELKTKNIKALYVGNHMSLLDPISLVGLFDEPMRMVGKKELKKTPIIGRFLGLVNVLFMDREDLKQSLKVILECSRILKDNEMNVVIFPEGTRNKKPLTTMPAPYHVGSFKAATKAGAPILPFCLYGTSYGFATKPDYRSVPMEIIFGKPIYKEEYEKMTPEELVDKIHKWTCEQVEKCRSFEKRYFEEGKQKIPYRKVWCKGKFFQKYDFDKDESLD